MDKIAVVILNWNGCEMLRSFLPSVVRYSKTEGAKIYVADNGSTDASVDMLRQEFPDVHLIILKENLGFAEGYNLALQIGGTPYTWILDSSLPGVQFGDFNSVLLIIIGVIANGSVALIALILVVILAWNYLKLLLEAAERYVVLGILVFTAPMAFAMGAARGTNNMFKSWCRMFSGQLLLLIMNAWCLKLFVNMVGEFLANPLSL